MHDSSAGIRTVITRAVFYQYPGGKNSWKRFFFDTNPGISFVVFKLNIVFRKILLDEVVFQQERIHFGINDNVLDIGNFLYKNIRFCMLVILVEVGRNPLFQVFCLSDVKNSPVFIEILIHSRFFRQRFQL
ncbi:hypothetical protein D3C80_766660 [compost metagenome]